MFKQTSTLWNLLIVATSSERHKNSADLIPPKPIASPYITPSYRTSSRHVAHNSVMALLI